MHECDHSNCDLFDSAQITQLRYPFGALGWGWGGPHEAQQNFECYIKVILTFCKMSAMWLECVAVTGGGTVKW